MITKERFKLANDVEIPKLGLGTWFIDDGDAARVVRDAVEIGYRHIDTARAYGNEAGVGEGVRTSGIERSELFVTTKLAAELKSYDEAAAGIDESLTNLGLDYADMMIIHSPKPWMKFHGDDHYFEGNREAWRALEDAYDAGKLRAIGLSNFERVDIDAAGCLQRREHDILRRTHCGVSRQHARTPPRTNSATPHNTTGITSSVA